MSGALCSSSKPVWAVHRSGGAYSFQELVCFASVMRHNLGFWMRHARPRRWLPFMLVAMLLSLLALFVWSGRGELPPDAIGTGFVPIDFHPARGGSVWESTVVMCKLDIAAHTRDPASLPMFRDLVAHSLCGQGQSIKLGELKRSIERHADVALAAGRPQRLDPSGFVFHQARCGSTLVANSESPCARHVRILPLRRASSLGRSRPLVGMCPAAPSL